MLFAPVVVSAQTPAALRVRENAPQPRLKAATVFDPHSISASAAVVIDERSRVVLLDLNADDVRPTASLAKLMTAIVAVDRAIPMSKTVAVSKADEVGGARLQVAFGTRLTIRDLFYAMLVGSANNAALAIARATGLGGEFAAAMNKKAASFGLAFTAFVDPSGIDPANVSTAREIAAIGIEAFSRDRIRSATTTAEYRLIAAKKTHLIKNTNDLLIDDGNGLYVTGGKTGYLPESGWNLLVRMRAEGQPPIVVVVLDSGSKKGAAADAEKLARWTWEKYQW